MAHPYDRIIAEMEEEFPRFRIIDKASAPSQKAIDVLLRIVTFGQMRSYMSSYHTTIGKRLYVAPGWAEKSDDDKYILLAHERVHMRQFNRYTFLGMSLLYLLFPLPMGAAWFRAKMEKEAYAETIRATAEVYGAQHVLDSGLLHHIEKQFTSASYGWMWPYPKSIRSWAHQCFVDSLGLCNQWSVVSEAVDQD